MEVTVSSFRDVSSLEVNQDKILSEGFKNFYEFLKKKFVIIFCVSGGIKVLSVYSGRLVGDNDQRGMDSGSKEPSELMVPTRGGVSCALG